MFLLTDDFEDAFEYKGQVLRLNLAFDNVLRLYDLFDDKHFDDWEKIVIALEMLLSTDSYENVKTLPLGDKHSLFLYIMKHFLDSDPDKKRDKDVGPPTFDFKQDAGIIYASFMNAYHMDLYEQQGRLHWKKFLQLFNHLPSSTKMQDVIQIRLEEVPAPNKHNSKERRELLKRKKQFALEGVKDPEYIKARNEFNFEAFGKMWKGK